MSILNALGKGMMPNFGMRGSRSSPFTNVSQDMLNTAATGEAMRQSIADKYSSDISAFTDGTAALKDIFGEKEASIEDLIPEENLIPEELEDDLVDYSVNEAALSNLSSDATNSALLGLFSPGGLFGKLGAATMGMNYSSDFGNEYIQDMVDMVDPEGTIRTVPSEEEEPFDFFGLMDFYRDAAGEDEQLNMVPNFMGTSESPYVGYEHGGRVHRGIGGTLDLAKLAPSQQQQALTPNKLAYGYTPFMDAQQGFDYYTQFQNPTFATPAVRVEDNNLGDFGNLGPQLPEGFSDPNAVPIQKQIAPVDPRAGRGPEDRPGYVDPGMTGTKYGFVDGKLVYTGLSPTNIRQGIKLGDEVGGIASPTMAIAKFFGSMLPSKETLERKFVPEGVKNFFSKKEADPKPAPAAKSYLEQKSAIQGGKVKDEKVAQALASSAARTAGRKDYQMNKKLQAMKDEQTSFNKANAAKGLAMTRAGDVYSTKSFSKKDRDRNRQNNRSVGRRASARDRSRASKGKTGGGFCFDPNTLVQMFDGSEKRIKDIKLGDKTKGGEVTGVFQFKAADEIHNYEGVIVAGSHYVKEDGKFIMVQDSPKAVKVDKIPVVHSLDTTGRRIWINDIEFADYNGDGLAKGFLANAGVDLTGFDQEVLRQVEHRLI